MRLPKWKKCRFAATLALLLAAACGPLAAQSKTPTPQEQANLKMVLRWYREVVLAGHVDLARKYMAEDYVDHDPNRQPTLASFVEHFGGKPPRPIAPTLSHPPIRAYAKGDYVVLLWEWEDKDPANPSAMYKYNSFDIVRIQNGKIQEHWDTDRKTPPDAARQ